MRRFIDLVESAEQPWYDAAWFVGSKIFDGSAQEPLIVHHFTYNDFEVFDRLWATHHFKRSPEKIDAVGLWFTTNPNARYVSAKIDAGARRLDCILHIARPLYFDDVREGDAFDQLNSEITTNGGSTKYRQAMKTKGYDGIVLQSTLLDNFSQTVLIAFDSDQVKIVNKAELRDS